MPELETVATKFQLSAPFSSVRQFGAGHINDTYLVILRSDARAVLQRINRDVFPGAWDVAANVALVVAHLEAAGGGVPGLIRTLENEPAWRDAEGRVWRMFDYIEDARTLQQVETADQAREAGRAFGDFQRRLGDFPRAKLYPAIPHFHDIGWCFMKFSSAATGDLTSISDDLAFVAERRHFADRRLTADDIVIHGDCKINNVLFDAEQDHVVAVIDLDTVMVGDRLWDFGDLVRSAAASGTEDAPTIDVSLSLFRAIAEGFLDGSGWKPDAMERDAMVRAPRVMALMLGVRFLTDYLVGNQYFKVDDPEHNLRRARAQFRLVSALERNGVAMTRIITELAG